MHPDSVAAQVMGAVTMGVSMTLYEGLTLVDGRTRERNYHRYRVVDSSHAPTVETTVLASSAPPGGAGEPGLPPVTAAIVNAIYAATGKRLRRLPVGDQLKA